MAKATLGLLIKAEDAASKVLQGITGETGKMESKWKLAGAAIGAVSTVAIGALSEMAREGAADAAAMEAVKVATENAGGSWDVASGQVETYLTKMRDLAAVDDAELKPALAGLIAVTGDYTESLELSSLAADVARGKNISLQSAADLVGKVAQGNLGTLSRYGIVLDENATSTEALAELQKRFAGQAEAYGATTQGQIESLTIKIGDWREEIGNTLGPAQGFIALLPGISAGFSGIGGAVGFLMPKLGGLFTFIKVSAIPGAASLIAALGPILLPIIAIGAAVGLLAIAWSNNWGDIQGKTKAAVDFIMGLLKPLFDFVGQVLDRLGAVGDVKLPGTDISMFDENSWTKTGANARGTSNWRGGLTWVGEEGPELLDLPGGSAIHSNAASRGMAGTTVVVNVQGSVVGASDLAEYVHQYLLAKGRRNVSVGLA